MYVVLVDIVQVSQARIPQYVDLSRAQQMSSIDITGLIEGDNDRSSVLRRICHLNSMAYTDHIPIEIYISNLR